MGRQTLKEVSSWLSTKISIAKLPRYQPSGASQTTDLCRAGSSMAAGQGFDMFFEAVNVTLVTMSVSLFTPNCAGRPGGGRLQMGLWQREPAPPCLSWEHARPWLHSCPLPDTSGTQLSLLPAWGHCWLSPPAGRARPMAPLQPAVPSLSSLFLLCCGNVTPATSSSSSPRPALEKEILTSRGFAFNSQRNKIHFKSIKKAPRKHCVLKDTFFQLFSVKGKKKPAKLIFGESKGFAAQH